MILFFQARFWGGGSCSELGLIVVLQKRRGLEKGTHAGTMCRPRYNPGASFTLF